MRVVTLHKGFGQAAVTVTTLTTAAGAVAAAEHRSRMPRAGVGPGSARSYLHWRLGAKRNTGNPSKKNQPTAATNRPGDGRSMGALVPHPVKPPEDPETR